MLAGLLYVVGVLQLAASAYVIAVVIGPSGVFQGDGLSGLLVVGGLFGGAVSGLVTGLMSIALGRVVQLVARVEERAWPGPREAPLPGRR